MILTLTRHGKTDWNKKHKLQGQSQTELDEEGIQEAEKLAERLKDEKFSHIYASDMQRTVQTTEIIARHHKAQVTFTPLLRERSLGIYEGAPVGSLDERSYAAIEGGESIDDIKERAKKFLNELPEDGKIFVVGHQAMDRAIISVMLNQKYEDTPHLHNTSISIFEKKDGQWKAVLLNDTSHLQIY